ELAFATAKGLDLLTNFVGIPLHPAALSGFSVEPSAAGTIILRLTAHLDFVAPRANPSCKSLSADAPIGRPAKAELPSFAAGSPFFVHALAWSSSHSPKWGSQDPLAVISPPVVADDRTHNATMGMPGCGRQSGLVR